MALGWDGLELSFRTFVCCPRNVFGCPGSLSSDAGEAESRGVREALVDEGGVERGEEEVGGGAVFSPPLGWEEGGVESSSGDARWQGFIA